MLVTVLSPDYTLHTVVVLDAVSLAQRDLIVQESHTLKFHFDMSFEPEFADVYASQVMNEYCMSRLVRCSELHTQSGNKNMMFF